MHIAYFANLYPAPAAGWLRREIELLESGGIVISRFSIRAVPGQLPDPADRAERSRTIALAELPRGRLLSSCVRGRMTSPLRLARSIDLAVALGLKRGMGGWRHLAYLAEASALSRELRARRCSHVHAYFGNSTTIAMLVESLTGIPFSFTVIGPEELGPAHADDLVQQVRRARFVVVENEFTLCQVRLRSPPECWNKLRLIPKSVDPFYLNDPTGAAAAGFPEFPRLVCVGRLVRRKGQSPLLRAVRVLKDELFVEVVFIGDGPERASLERQIADLGLEDRVRLLGWLDRSGIKREVLAARSLVLPSLSEGLPTVLLEALALGRPVIATDVAAVSELVSHRENGWLIRPGSISELVDAIREAMTMSGAQLAAMGAAGRRTVSERHGVRSVTVQLLDLFTRVVREPEPIRSGTRHFQRNHRGPAANHHRRRPRGVGRASGPHGRR